MDGDNCCPSRSVKLRYKPCNDSGTNTTLTFEGIGLVIVNTMLEPMSEDLGFDKNVGGAVATSVFYIGAMVGGLIAGPFEKASGKFAQLWIGALYAFGNIFAGLTTDSKVCWGGPFDGCVAKMLFAGRVLTGLASGLMLVVSPKCDISDNRHSVL